MADIYHLTLHPPVLCQTDAFKPFWQHRDHDGSRPNVQIWECRAVNQRQCGVRTARARHGKGEHLQGHPVHRCAAPPFWPFCCWSPERNELYACRRRPPLPLARLLHCRPPAKSRRSPKPAIWFPQAKCSFGLRDRHSFRRLYTLWFNLWEVVDVLTWTVPIRPQLFIIVILSVQLKNARSVLLRTV